MGISNGIVYPPGITSPLGQAQLLDDRLPQVAYVGWNGTVFHLAGGQAAMPGVQTGMTMLNVSGLQPSFTLLDNLGARQDGITWLDSLYDPCIIDLTVEASGVDARSFRRVVRDWIAAWRPDRTGTLSWFTQQLGEWWMPVRQARAFPDQYAQAPAQHLRQRLTWRARGDNAFWQGPDSTSVVDGTGGLLSFLNLGTQACWPRYLIYGPGNFLIGDGDGENGKTATMIPFGPLLDGQIALITTLPRLRSVVDLSPSAPVSQLNEMQKFIENLVNVATGNQVPPLLQYFESFFGILPPQGPMYSLLGGRFSNPIPGKPDGVAPVPSFVPIQIQGASSTTKVIGAITPQRTYPE